MVTCLDGIAAIAGDDDVAVVGKYRMVAECGDPLAAVTADRDGAVVYDRRVISAGDDTSIVVSVHQDDAGRAVDECDPLAFGGHADIGSRRAVNGTVIGQRDGFGDVARIPGEQPDTVTAVQIDGAVVGDVAGISGKSHAVSVGLADVDDTGGLVGQGGTVAGNHAVGVAAQNGDGSRVFESGMRSRFHAAAVGPDGSVV